MKTVILLLSAFFAFSNTSIAQDTLKAKTGSLPTYFATAKVSYTGNLHDLQGMSTVNLKIADNVSPKVKDAFFAAFKNASNDKWFFHDKKGKEYLVKFDYDERDYKTLLNKKGKVSSIIYDGSERDLTTDTRKNIKSWYADYNVVGLVKVDPNSQNVSYVNLKNANDLIIISVEDDVITEVGPYKIVGDNTITPKKKKANNTSVAKRNTTTEKTILPR